MSSSSRRFQSQDPLALLKIPEDPEELLSVYVLPTDSHLEIQTKSIFVHSLKRNGKSLTFNINKVFSISKKKKK